MSIFVLMKTLVDILEANHRLDNDQLAALLTTNDHQVVGYLCRRARAVAQEQYGTGIYLRGLIELSNVCRNDCLYCGIRRSNRHVDRYTLTPEQVMGCCEQGYQLGFRTFVLQGGEWGDERAQWVADIVSNMRRRWPDCAITLSLGDYDKLERIVDMCEKSGVHTKFIPDYNSLFPSNPYTEDLMGLPLINIRYVPLSNTLYAFIKRCMDIAGACFCLVLFSPVMLAAAIGTAISGGGPVIFKQERIGMHGRPFQMYKFRTMIEQAPEDEERAWTTKEDARVTRFGRILRKTSIDEMPQFVNVLMGNMSLVGPRPERPQFVEKFKEEIPRYMVKHQVRPGITGWAQVNGYRGDTSIRKRIEYDLYYIENWSIGFDFKILLMTIFRGFINKNAY